MIKIMVLAIDPQGMSTKMFYFPSKIIFTSLSKSESMR